jgi:ankyrin repeat protein
LLKNGADINKQARWDKSPLLLVAGTKNLKAAQFLLDKGADLNAVQFWKATCLHEAVFWNQPETLKYFISKGLSPNTVANNGSSPLHWTIWRINKEKEESIKQSAALINILLDSGVDKSLKTKDGKTAADLAKDKGLEKIATLLKP